MKILNKIPTYIRTAVLVTVLFLIPITLFAVFCCIEMYSRWEKEATQPYQQCIDSISEDLSNTLYELTMKSNFLTNSEVIQNATYNVNNFALSESISFIIELSQLIDAITVENPHMQFQLYPQRCTYTLGSYCRSYELFCQDFSDNPILMEQLQDSSNGDTYQTLRINPINNMLSVSLCSKVQLFDDADAVIELSIPVDYAYGEPENFPDDATIKIMVNPSEANSQPYVINSDNTDPTSAFVVLNSFVGEKSHIEIQCIFPQASINKYIAKEILVFVCVLVLMTVFMFVTSLVTSKLFYSRVLGVIYNISDSVDSILHSNPTELGNDSDLVQLEQKVYCLIEQTKHYYEANLEYAETQQRMELELLQMRFNPHFLYNTLNTIRFQAKNPTIRSIVDSLVSYYRIVLNKGNLIISVKDELQMIEEYLKIECYAYSMDNVTWKIVADNQVGDCAVIKHILQPIVENALFHGVRAQPQGGAIGITVSKEGNDVLFTITDNGPGMDSNQIAAIMDTDRTSSSYGISNVRQRISSYYGNNYGLKMESEVGCGTCVTIRIPMIPLDI